MHRSSRYPGIVSKVVRPLNEDALSRAMHGESHEPCATPPFTPEKSKIRGIRFHRDMDTRVCQKMNCELTEPRLY